MLFRSEIPGLISFRMDCLDLLAVQGTLESLLQHHNVSDSRSAQKGVGIASPALQFQFSPSVVSSSLPPHELQHARPPCPSPTPGVHSNSTSNESVMPSSHPILCHPLLLPPIPPSIRVFSNESTLRMRWPKYWSFSFSISSPKKSQG